MNNNQFRKLVLDTPARQDDGTSGTRPGATPSALGAKRSSFMPMTPRTVRGGPDVSFAQQVRERNAALRPTKKFKSSTPKGAKFAAGYTDRAKVREEAGDDEDEKAARIKALEEQMKLGQISQDMFEALRDEITGGDASATHLVKGLDRKLLERVKRGEDVMGTGASGGDEASLAPDLDEELDKVVDKDIEAVKREKVEKKGMMAPPPIAGVKRSRDDILAELRAQRKAAAEAKQTAIKLDDRWRKVGEKENSRIVIDHKGREVLITVDEDGMVKRKVRKLPAESAEAKATTVEMPDASRPVLGADAAIPVPVAVSDSEANDEDDDIFTGVGTEYNPLGDEAEDDDDDDDTSDAAADKTQERKVTAPRADVTASSEPDDERDDISEAEQVKASEPPPKPAQRNYFSDPKTTAEDTKTADRYAGIESVLAKAAKLDPLWSAEKDGDNDESKEARESRLKKRAQMLAQQDRDFDDMDMGFGSSRYEDEEEGGDDGKKMKLSEWKGGEDEGEEDGGKGGGKRKRKPKKRKGDVNNAADIMRVIEGRKNGK